MDKFNRYVNQKKQQYLKNLQRPHSSPNAYAFHEDQFNERSVGLQQKNLNQIYGRVRQKFNKQIRMGATLKYKQLQNNGRQLGHQRTTYEQREATLQDQIDGLVRSGEDLSLEGLQQKLNEQVLPMYDQRKTSAKYNKKLTTVDKDMDKFNQLAEIYSNYKTDLPFKETHHHRQPGPKSQHNAYIPETTSFARLENVQAGRQSGRVVNADLSSHQNMSKQIRNVN